MGLLQQTALGNVELPDDIIEAEEFEESLNVIIVGENGIGKTVFAGDAGLIICTEKGAVSVKRNNKKAKLWRAHNWGDVQAAYMWLKKNPTVFRWVAIDSGPEMQDLLLKDILYRANADSPRPEPEVPQIQDHNIWQHKFKGFVKAFCDLPFHTLFTALPMTVEDEEGNKLVVPAFAGKGYQISSWVCGQMSIIGHMKLVNVKVTRGEGENAKEVKEQRRRIYFQPHITANDGMLFAKDRYAALGKFKDNFTLTRLDALVGEGEIAPAKPARSAKAKVAPSKQLPLAPEPAEPAAPEGQPESEREEKAQAPDSSKLAEPSAPSKTSEPSDEISIDESDLDD